MPDKLASWLTINDNEKWGWFASKLARTFHIEMFRIVFSAVVHLWYGRCFNKLKWSTKLKFSASHSLCHSFETECSCFTKNWLKFRFHERIWWVTGKTPLNSNVLIVIWLQHQIGVIIKLWWKFCGCLACVFTTKCFHFLCSFSSLFVLPIDLVLSKHYFTKIYRHYQCHHRIRRCQKKTIGWKLRAAKTKDQA